MRIKLVRVLKDGERSTYNNEEFDYLFLNEEDSIIVLRHFVV